MTAESIAHGLDLRRAGANRWRGACLCCGGSSRFQVRAGRSGDPLVYCWSCRDSAAIIRALQQRGLWPSSDWTPQQRRDFAKQHARDEADLRVARLFADAAAILAEQTLEDLSPFDAERRLLMRLLSALRTDTGILTEYREWRSRNPKITRALVNAGDRHRLRLEMLLSNWLCAGAAHAA